MCGLTGYWTAPDSPRAELEARVAAMTDTLVHRGPNGSGTWCDPAAGIALGHRRLAIIDLSPEGAQPMRTPDGRHVLVYNGEVFNFPELRRELEAEGVRFRGHSDTEVLLHALTRWGIERALARFVGQFAFALWDARERRLVLARDRLGIKPLYFGVVPGSRTLLFGSELKALAAHPEFRGEVERDALALHLRHGYIPAPGSIWRGIEKLEPGRFLVFSAPDARPARTTYWDGLEVARVGCASPLALGEEEAVDRLEEALKDAVRLRLVSDVPLGAFLSGGIDSSLVVALMRAVGTGDVRTFTIGFEENDFDEAPHARRVAAHLGTRHTELVLSTSEAQAIVPTLPQVWDEPFADSSQIPTALVSRLAASEVTVALSGDGGDELFGGYRRYARARRVWRVLGAVPEPARRAARALLDSLAPATWDALLRPLRPLARRVGQPAVGAAVAKLADLLGTSGEREFYRHVVSHWKDPARLVRGDGVTESASLLDRNGPPLALPTLVERMMALDLVTYLPGDILCKVDRASMAHGLEARVPLLDHRVVELAWRLPAAQRVGPDPGKRLLRAVLARHVPRALFEREKQGFGIPLGAWLRGPLRTWAEELLAPERLEREGFLSQGPIRALWRRHQDGTAHGEHYLWDVLTFQAWLEHWGADGRRARRPEPRVEAPPAVREVRA